MRNGIIINIIGAISLSFISFAAVAETPWYGSVAVGASRTDIGLSDWDDGSLQSGSVDQQGLGYAFLGGYRIEPRMWLEAAWVDLGNTAFKGVSFGGLVWDIGDVRGETSTQGLSVTVAGAKALGPRVTVYAKGGLFAWDSSVFYDPTITGRIKVNDDGIDLTYGFGAEIQTRKNWSVRAGWDRYGVDFAKTGTFAVDFLSIGMVWHVP